MKTELRELIEAYQSKANELISRLSNALGFKLPVKNAEWVGLDMPQHGRTHDGIEYLKHGYGVAIKYGRTKMKGWLAVFGSTVFREKVKSKACPKKQQRDRGSLT